MLYQLYGLVIASNDMLPGVPSAAETEVDAWIRSVSLTKPFPSPSNWFMKWYLPKGEPWLSLAKIDGGYLLRFNELVDFFVKNDGKEIFCMPGHGIPSDTIQHLLLDQVIPLVINLKGGEALHVSAVLTAKGAVAFAGPTGSGKSTVAGSLLNMGYPLLSDDCLVLTEKDEKIYAIPAYPGLRLWGDALKCLFGNDVVYESVAHYTTKQRLCIEGKSEAYRTEPQPLRRLYFIPDSIETEGKTQIMIEHLSPRESFMALVRCAFRLDITDHDMLKRQFHFLERVVSTISVRRLIFPRNFNLLPAVREAIINDLNDLDN
ncbi:MAG: hypothetical protein COS40_02070 [Deltaproteobacteria bacterium CG03_land_8_20_14_0_80_45_14]|nr:MAG: hypothetical protein COS40_02070 [Deltaproteobacteria bacterium CG03_land_8_20_14_0_80_45_14]